MRSMTTTGPCAACGKTTGPFWANTCVVLDFENGSAPMEPNMMTPIRCDACEGEAQIRATFAEDPALAERIWCCDRSEIERLVQHERRLRGG